MLGQAVHWKSRAVSLIRFCMLNGSRTALKPSSLMRRITFTMSAHRAIGLSVRPQTSPLSLRNRQSDTSALSAQLVRVTLYHDLAEALSSGRFAPKLSAVGPWYSPSVAVCPFCKTARSKLSAATSARRPEGGITAAAAACI